MPDLFESYGLESLVEDEESYGNLQKYVAMNGKPIKGYYGTPYFYLPAGDTEFWESTKRNEDNNLEIFEFHVHCCSQNIWKMVFTGIDLTPKSWPKTERLLLMNRDSDEGGSIPVDIINADVLPSFLEGDRIDVQVVAPCLDVRYYASEEDYEADAPADRRGKKWMIATGSLLPVGFLSNHLGDAPENDEENTKDRYISFVAKVKGLRCGAFQFNEQSKLVPSFIRCIAETQYGEVQFHHTFDQVPEDMRDNIRVGAIITGTCILSADAVLGEYEDGIVKDAEHNLQLVRFTLSKGESERLRSVLTDQSVYETDNYKLRFSGPDEIIERLKYVNENHKGKYLAYNAEIVETAEHEMEYSVGTKCFVLVNEDTDEDIESIVFVDTSEDGSISRIKVCTDDRYTVCVHRPERRKTLLDDVELEAPDNVTYYIMTRAMLHGFIDVNTEQEQIENDPDRESHEAHVRRILDALQEDKQEDVIQAFKNIIGYLFAKAVETGIVQRKDSDKSLETQKVVYDPYDAIRGILHTTLGQEQQENLIEDMRLAQQFGMDVFSYMKKTNKTDADFINIFTEAAVAAQRIGQLYSIAFV